MRKVTRNYQLTDAERNKYWVPDEEIVVTKADRDLNAFAAAFARYYGGMGAGPTEEHAREIARDRMMRDRRQEAYDNQPAIEKERIEAKERMKKAKYYRNKMEKKIEEYREELKRAEEEYAAKLEEYNALFDEEDV